MAHYATIITAAEHLPIDATTAAALGEALMESDDHGFQIFHGDDGALIMAEESGDEERLPARFVTLLGQVLAEAGLPYLEFGAAMISSKMLPGSHGGYKFRITAAGVLVWPKLDWSSSEESSPAPTADRLLTVGADCSAEAS